MSEITPSSITWSNNHTVNIAAGGTDVNFSPIKDLKAIIFHINKFGQSISSAEKIDLLTKSIKLIETNSKLDNAVKELALQTLKVLNADRALEELNKVGKENCTLFDQFQIIIGSDRGFFSSLMHRDTLVDAACRLFDAAKTPEQKLAALTTLEQAITKTKTAKDNPNPLIIGLEALKTFTQSQSKSIGEKIAIEKAALKETQETDLKSILAKLDTTPIDKLLLHIDNFREKYMEILDTGFPIGRMQEINTQLMDKFFCRITSAAQANLAEKGKPFPESCKFAMVKLGSQAVNMTSPYSDIDYAILINNPAHKGYMIELAKEMEAIHPPRAFPFCEMVSPTGKLGEKLIGTVEDLAGYLTPKTIEMTGDEEADELINQENFEFGLMSTSLTVNAFITGAKDLHDSFSLHCKLHREKSAVSLDPSSPAQPKAQVTELGLKMLTNAASFGTAGVDNTKTWIDIKREIIRLPSMCIDGLCACHNLDVTGKSSWEKLKLLSVNKCIDPILADRIKQTLEFGFIMRYKSHLKLKSEEDILLTANIAANRPLILLTDQEKIQLQRHMNTIATLTGYSNIFIKTNGIVNKFAPA